MIEFRAIHPAFTAARAGYLPQFASETDPRPAKEQFDQNYIAGWNPFKGFKLDLATMELTYPGDPPMAPIAVAQLRDELIYLYPHDWVLILQPDRSWEISRMD